MEGGDLAEAILEEEEIVEKEITIFEDEDNIEEEINWEDETNVGRHEDDKFVEPKCGMSFPDLDALYAYWKAYGTSKGFPIRRRTSKKVDGLVSFISYMCSLGEKPGSKSSNPLKLQANTRLGCPVKLSAHLSLDGQWRITRLNLQHNHALSPSKSRYFRHNRSIPANTRRRLELNDRAGIRANQNIRACIEESGGYENATYILKDARNHIDKARHLRLGQGDAMAIQNYFLKMQAQSPGFFFSMDLDEVEGRLQNVFWADARSREAYKEFGRVVTFDTTYLVDRYDMPFAPFVGVNHHGQSVLLGCGLISSEKTETFIWLFQTWLTCMSDCAPEGIITDQDRAMQNAIEIVFPNTWCLWHITNKIPQKLGSYKANASIISDMFNCIYDSQKPIDFELNWNAMIDKYCLQDNDWLNGLYDQRHRWIPCFLKSCFWAGMSTTQRSESINAFFDGYVNKKTSLKQFVEQYGNALRSKVEKETQADYRSFSQTLPLATRFEMEKQFQGVYTHSKFKEFQKELLDSMLYCEQVSKKEYDLCVEWVIEEDVKVEDGISKKVSFIVLINKTESTIKCSCQLFEFRGILCKHALSAFLKEYGNIELPDKYIFKLWRKDVKRCHSRVKIPYDGWIATDEEKRYEHLCTIFTKVADLASFSENKYSEMLVFLESLKEHFSSNVSNSASNIPLPIRVQSASSNAPSIHQDILDPICKRTKGRPSEKRKVSFYETIKKKKRKEALENNEPSTFEKPKIQKKQNKRMQKSKKVPKDHEITPSPKSNFTQDHSRELSISKIHEVTPTQTNMSLHTCSRHESVALGVRPTQERLYIHDAYTREHVLPYDMITPQISQNSHWYYVNNPQTGYGARVNIRPPGYGEGVSIPPPTYGANAPPPSN